LEAGKYKILLVDDDCLNQRMMSLVLSEGDYLYDKAFNGAEALEAVKSQKFDLILMDLQMPIMDGYEATKRIRAWEAGNGHIPIIALTAMIFDEDRQLCLDAGMDDCIVKPFDTAELYRIINSYIEKAANSGMRQSKLGKELEKENSLLDIEAALPRFGNDPQIYQEFLLEFLQSLPERMGQFRSMFASGNFQSLSKDSHNLKGVAASLGAMKLSASAAKLNKQSRVGASDSIPETLEECDRAVLTLNENAMNVLSRYSDKKDII
jgi:two-component system sensor histidine kinase/response regulator